MHNSLGKRAQIADNRDRKTKLKFKLNKAKLDSAF